MAPLGIPMSEEEYYEPGKRPKAAEVRKPGETARPKPEQTAQTAAPKTEAKPSRQDEPAKSEAAPAPSKAPAGQAETARSFTDEYRQQMRNAAILQAKQAELLQRQSEQLDFSQKLLERYDAILARHEQKLNES